MKMNQNLVRSIRMISSFLKLLVQYLVIKPYQVLITVFPENKI